jgi:GNAT superfamily N-acetyltransferase
VELGLSLRPPEPLGPEHAVAGFGCGVPALDLWLRRRASVGGDPRSAALVVADGGGRVIGFYGLSAAGVRNTDAPPGTRRGAPEPVLKLGRLAVDQPSQGRGIGTALVMDAFARTYAVSRHALLAALMADAPDARAAEWLRWMGFQPVAGDATALFVPLGTIEALVERRGRGD